MTARAATLLLLAARAFAATTHVPEPNPPLNANPTDTSNPLLVGKAFPFNALPEEADTSGPQPGVVYRGPQFGYNICNSTTEGPDALCQTLIVNTIQDFCIWAPSKPNSTIGDTEGEEIAWCSKKGHGSRIIPANTITGLQYIRTPSYVAMTGNLNLANVNIFDDGGGEMDSGGQDGRGNPLGGLAYSNNLPSSNGMEIQSRTWHFFIGGGVFCMKFCDPNAPDALGLCQHIYDRIGCNYNVPAAYQNGAFLSCLGDDQDPVGIFTGADGQITTFNQGPENVVPMPPYTPRIPATSSCQTFQSAQLFTDAPAATGSSTTASTTGSATGPAGGVSSGATGSGSASKSGAAATGTGAARPAAGGAVGSALLAVLVACAAMLVGAAVVV